jgi:hypothetical protein
MAPPPPSPVVVSSAPSLLPDLFPPVHFTSFMPHLKQQQQQQPYHRNLLQQDEHLSFLGGGGGLASATYFTDMAGSVGGARSPDGGFALHSHDEPSLVPMDDLDDDFDSANPMSAASTTASSGKYKTVI